MNVQAPFVVLSRVQPQKGFQSEFRDRLAKFGLELHPAKTGLIEFGRFVARDRQQRGEANPESLDSLGFTD